MTTAELVRFFQVRRQLDFRPALARAESVVIRHVYKPDRPRGSDKDQLRIQFGKVQPQAENNLIP